MPQVAGPGGENHKGTLVVSGSKELGFLGQDGATLAVDSICKRLPRPHPHSGMLGSCGVACRAGWRASALSGRSGGARSVAARVTRGRTSTGVSDPRSWAVVHMEER